MTRWEQEVLRLARAYREDWERCVRNEIPRDADWKR